MSKIASIAVMASLLSSAASAAEPPRYVAPPPQGDSKSTIISGILMVVNGFIMSEADRRHQPCATFVAGLDRNGFPLFRHACRASQDIRQE
jgi:hypothetical protein